MNVFECAILAAAVLVYKAMRRHVDVVKKRNVCLAIKNMFVTTNANVLSSVVVINAEKRLVKSSSPAQLITILCFFFFFFFL